MHHSRPARLFDDFANTPQARLDRLRSAAHLATIDPEIRQMSDRYMRWLMNDRASGVTWEQFKAQADKPARPVSAAFARADARLRGAEPEDSEPGPVELAEMRSASYLSEIADFCRNFRTARERPVELKEALNLAFQSEGIPLKVINWTKWGHQ